MQDPLIQSLRVIDVRFPTSRVQVGSDAMNPDPDYSAAYCILSTDTELEGHGLTFTLGRGTELCVDAIRYLGRFLKGRRLSSITDDFAAFARSLTDDSQFRWLGPESHRFPLHRRCDHAGGGTRHSGLKPGDHAREAAPT